MSRCPHRAAGIPPGSEQRSSCERCASTRGTHRLHQAACLDRKRLKAPAPSPGRILRSSCDFNLNANAQSWIFLLFELSLGETRPSAECLRSSGTPSLRGLVDIAYLFWFHSRHGWCEWLHELGQNRQANIMASRHVPGQLAEAVILAHQLSAPNAHSLRLFPFHRRTCMSFYLISAGPPSHRADRDFDERAGLAIGCCCTGRHSAMHLR